MTLSPAYRSVLWWAVYLCLALWVQKILPGIDAFTPALILACQEKHPWQLLWLMLICLLIQEGTGNLAFGGGILYYGALVAMFRIGQLFFVTSGLFFVLLLSLGLGLVRAGILLTFISLQSLAVPPLRLAEETLVQVLLIPPLWGAALLTRRWFVRHEDDGI